MLPPFSTAMAATPKRTDRTLESDHLDTGPAEQGGAARSAAERRHTAENRGASPCAYYERALEESTGDSAVLFMGTCSASPRKASACLLHAGPCETPRGWACRPLAMRRVSEGLPRPRPRARCSVVAEALQFAELLKEDGPRLDPASYVTTGSHDTPLRRW